MATGSSNNTNQQSLPSIPITLKWSKQSYSNEIYIHQGCTAISLKEEILALTGVPTHRQKLLCRSAWKGTLQNDFIFTNLPETKNKSILVVTLIGSAEKPPDPRASRSKTKFIEDFTEQEIAKEAGIQATKDLENAEGMIPCLQKLPGSERDEDKNKVGSYQYNHFVNGLPQWQIEDMFRRRRVENSNKLLGEVGMTLGMELRRAYINTIGLLEDGTLVSGCDDGRVHFWRHGEKVGEVVHEGRLPGGVDCMVVLRNDEWGCELATGGRGCVRLWTGDGECVAMFESPFGVTPSSLVEVHLEHENGANNERKTTSSYLVTSFRVVYQPDPNRFRLLPQNEEGLRRRAEAQAQEAVLQDSLSRAVRCLQLWCAPPNNNDDNNTSIASFVGVQSQVLEPENHEDALPVTALAVLSGDTATTKNNHSNECASMLIAGDEVGGLRVWKCHNINDTHEQIRCEQMDLLQLQPQNSTDPVSIVCMQPLKDDLLAVSTEQRQNVTPSSEEEQSSSHLSQAHTIPIPSTSAVFIIDIEMRSLNVVLDAHKDTVRCMASLHLNGGGGLATGGGKMDATIRLWDEEQVYDTAISFTGAEESAIRTTNGEQNDNFTLSPQPHVFTDAPKLKEVGYVFAMVLVPDTKPGSEYFALALARYNVVKICL